MDNPEYDVVVVGAGVAGALVAKTLTKRGLRVLVLEAGPATAQTLDGYEAHLQRYYAARSKGPEAPWPPSHFAPQPDTADLKYSNGYFVQNGPHLYGSSYSRTLGGSTLHWLGVSLRMLPEDFEMKSRFGVGLDWPLHYDDLEPFYRKAEWELGVAANVADQSYQGITFANGYEFPMQRVPQSYSDQRLGAAIDGMNVTVGGHTASVRIRSYPAARNSIPRGDYKPKGMVDSRPDGTLVERYAGDRCQGNTACIPICPVQAKYNANKTLVQADQSLLTIRPQAVVNKLWVNAVTGEIETLGYQRYDGNTHTIEMVKARAYVLAAHAIENAKIMLMSGLNGPQDMVGRHLMDHPTLYAWGLAKEPVGPFRGPQSTSGMEDLRSGSFRSKFAAFRFDVGNDGWKATVGAPDTTIAHAVMNEGRFGKDLRKSLASTLSRQIRFSLAVEQMPDPNNRVTLDRQFLDPLGNPRPAIDYRLDEYTLEGMVAATSVYQQMFRQAGVADCTGQGGAWFPSAEYGNRTFYYHGMGHFAGTHLMGDQSTNSVVNHHQRAWQHNNLYLIGSGSFPTMGTSNPTLTLAALAIRTAEYLGDQLTLGAAAASA